MSKVTICLNMIVKNESKIIKRLLTSVLPIIDTYVICDTGSTDDTPNIITTFFNEHNISGQVIHEPFKNFGYNRTFALKAAYGKATYALLLDADMIFKIEPSFDKQSLTAGSYLIIQRGGTLSYHNTRLIRLDINATCVGPTHEYYDFPAGTISEKLDSIWIADIGDGGSKTDKFERDIRLLKEGIKDEPNNGRYYFYLANSYFNTGRHAESIPYYRKRIELGGWYEEVFYAHLNLGHAYMTVGQEELAICTWMNGYNIHSSRAETIYEITKYYREKGKHKIGMAFCMLGRSIPYPQNDSLFIHNDIYDTGFDYELSILGYYNGYPNLHKLICKLLNKLPSKYDNLLSNYKFYTPKLSNYLERKISNSCKESITVCGTTYEMNGSNPCIFKNVENKYMLNIRMVNYYLNSNGSYHFPIDDGKIVTVNKIYELDTEFNIKTDFEPLLFIPNDNNMRYVGIEDLKPYVSTTSQLPNENKCAFMGTIQSPRTNNISIGYGELDMKNSTLEYKVVETIWNKGCEKNWVFYDDYNVIYQWFPLTIGKIKKRENELYLDITETKNMPEFFRHIRGSSNGYEFNNEIWFICHVVEYSQPREYYHCFVVFDKNTMTLNRWSYLFKYEGEKIEYSLGLIVNTQNIIISYSKWDRDPTIGIYNKQKIETEMF